mmetsp:Transcript_116859/g.225384  ORF Transcript_116859/g.225384 Transcript_116859/m.225384 type:complete len:228 (-) Transcript_116859:15-698(-)
MSKDVFSEQNAAMMMTSLCVSVVPDCVAAVARLLVNFIASIVCNTGRSPTAGCQVCLFAVQKFTGSHRLRNHLPAGLTLAWSWMMRVSRGAWTGRQDLKLCGNSIIRPWCCHAGLHEPPLLRPAAIAIREAVRSALRSQLLELGVNLQQTYFHFALKPINKVVLNAGNSLLTFRHHTQRADILVLVPSASPRRICLRGPPSGHIGHTSLPEAHACLRGRERRMKMLP